jgi:hypothetical protein
MGNGVSMNQGKETTDDKKLRSLYNKYVKDSKRRNDLVLPYPEWVEEREVKRKQYCVRREAERIRIMQAAKF